MNRLAQKWRRGAEVRSAGWPWTVARRPMLRHRSVQRQRRPHM